LRQVKRAGGGVSILPAAWGGAAKKSTLYTENKEEEKATAFTEKKKLRSIQMLRRIKP